MLVGSMLAAAGIVDASRAQSTFAALSIELVVGVGIPAILVLMGFRLARNNYSSEEAFGIVQFMLVGAIVAAVPVVWTVLHEVLEGDAIFNPVLILSTAIAVTSSPS